jgi:hypothetical protein
MNRDASSDRELRQLAHEQARIQMTVERIEHGARDVHADTRIDIRRARRRENLHWQVELPNVACIPCLFLETCARTTQHEQTTLGQAKRVVATICQLLVQLATREQHVAQHSASALCAFAIGGLREVDDPRSKRRIETRTNVERTGRVQQPAQT